MPQYLLGIDVGTTGTKTILFSDDGKILGHAYRGYSLSAPRVSWSEQNALDWWDAVRETAREVCGELKDPENVAAISLSLQGGTVVPVDEEMSPLRPAIVWNDGRAGAQFEAFQKEVAPGKYAYEHCGWNMNSSLPVLETRWIRDNEPDVFAKTKMILTVPDFISMKMTGIPACDLADAGINEFCDIREEKYDPNMLRFAGITEEMLPKIVHTGEVIGHLTKEAAQELGLTESTVLVAGAHDQYAVAVGAGANRPGDVMIGSGTAWVVTGISDKPAFETGLAQSVAAVPGLWGSIFSLSTGGVCLEWLRNHVALGEGGEKLSYDLLNEEIASRRAAEDGLFFYPFQGIAGEGRRFRKASFTGLDLAHDRFHMARAVMEGVVFETVWMMESFPAGDGGAIRLAGGASKSRVWSRMIADISGRAVLIPEVADLACVGAAVIAGWGCGLYPDIETGCRSLAVKTAEIRPDEKKTDMYKTAFEQYKEGARNLAALYGI